MNKRKTLIMSPADSKLFRYFKDKFEIIESDNCTFDAIYERQHADMQILKIKDTVFVNSQCKTLISNIRKKGINPIICSGIGNRYPENVALNAALIGDKLLCKESALHPKVKEFCINNSIRIINVNQGYTNCSTLILNDNTIITDDENIFKISLINNISVLKINKDSIYLDSETNGFIGGASAVIDNVVYFFGNIKNHKDANDILTFIINQGMTAVSITEDTLKDIGSIVIL